MTDENTSGDNGKLLYCSFCGKSQNEVRKLIAGPSVFICDECVDLCNDIIREEIQESSSEGEDAKLPIPEEINEILNQYVIGQQKAREFSQSLSTTITSASAMQGQRGVVQKTLN